MRRREFIKAAIPAIGLLTLNEAAEAKRADDELSPITITAVGDCIITRKVSQLRDPRFLDLVKILRGSDCAVGNCEMTFGDASQFEPAPKGRDMNLICESFGADELKWMGFDLMGSANNHAMDYGAAGLASTLRQLQRVGIAYAGAGPSLARASAPGYADTPGGRVALVDCASSFPTWSAAEDARFDSNGRSGINPLRLDYIYQLEAVYLGQLQAISAAISGKQGVASETSPATEFRFLGNQFKLGANGVIITPQARDLDRIADAIRVAKRNAALVVVGIHEHQHHNPGSYLSKFARECIDSGADVFWNAGPHRLGGIEIYKGKPIFYSLGNFFFQYETVKQVPTDVFAAYDVDIRATDPTLSYDVMSRIYFNTSQEYWVSFVPRMTFVGSKLVEVAVYPIDLGMKNSRFSRGIPVIAKDDIANGILVRLKNLSEAYGTSIDIKAGKGFVSL